MSHRDREFTSWHTRPLPFEVGAAAVLLSLATAGNRSLPLVLGVGIAASGFALWWGIVAVLRLRRTHTTRGWSTAGLLMTLGIAAMVSSMVGIAAVRLGTAGPGVELIVQIAGLLTYTAWPTALYFLPSRRALQSRRLPWLMDVALTVTAVSSAGWFFVVAPQVRLDGSFTGLWLTFAFPIANLLSVAGVVAAASLGGPFRSARGLLMGAIIANVAGDVVQQVGIGRAVWVPPQIIHLFWIVSVILAGLAAAQIQKDVESGQLKSRERSEEEYRSRGFAPMAFLFGLVLLALFGNWLRPNTRDALGLGIGCLVATACALVRLRCLIQDNEDLARTVSLVNLGLDRQVRERTAQLSEAKEDLDRQHAFLRSVIDAMPGHVLAFTPDGKLTLANEAAARFHRRSVDSMVGMDYYDLVVASDPSAVEHLQRETDGLLSGEESFLIEREAVGADGIPRQLEIAKTAVPGVRGEPDQVLVVANDISVRKEAERTLVSARIAAEKATQVKTAFLANMSHEIRTPMNGVFGFLDLLLTENISHTQREMAKSARHSAESLKSILDDVLDLAKLDAGSVSLQPSATSLGDLCADVIKDFEVRAHEKGLALRLDVQLEPSDQYLLDSARFRPVLTNLISNALKFTASGGIEVVVKALRSAQDLTTVAIEVKDTGLGIPESQLQAIFEPFSQGDNSATRKFGGTGLGLSICRELVNLHGGSIGVTSQVGHGSCFTVELPLRRIEGAQSRPEQERVLTSDFRVLVVEDNLVNQKVLKRVLERLHFRVEIANNGKEALDFLAQNGCDLILMDCQMPVMDGLEATRCIRKMPTASRNIPIIAVTANAMDGDRETCLAAGMDDYVPKPINQDALAKAISRVAAIQIAA